MFSCSHFGNFLSDPIEKQSAMSKRGQEATSREGSTMAKPRPTVPAMAKSVSSVSWSAKGNPPQELGHPVNPENDDEGQGDHTRTRRLERITLDRKVSGDRKKLIVQIFGNSLIRRNLQTLPAHVELCGQQHQDQSFKIGSTRTISA